MESSARKDNLLLVAEVNNINSINNSNINSRSNDNGRSKDNQVQLRRPRRQRGTEEDELKRLRRHTWALGLPNNINNNNKYNNSFPYTLNNPPNSKQQSRCSSATSIPEVIAEQADEEVVEAKEVIAMPTVDYMRCRNCNNKGNTIRNNIIDNSNDNRNDENTSDKMKDNKDAVATMLDINYCFNCKHLQKPPLRKPHGSQHKLVHSHLNVLGEAFGPTDVLRSTYQRKGRPSSWAGGEVYFTRNSARYGSGGRRSEGRGSARGSMDLGVISEPDCLTEVVEVEPEMMKMGVKGDLKEAGGNSNGDGYSGDNYGDGNLVDDNFLSLEESERKGGFLKRFMKKIS